MQRILSPVPMPARLCILLAAALCLLALSACGQTQDPETPAAETETASTAAQPEAAPAEQAQDVEVTRGEDGRWTITREGTTIGGAGWFPYPGGDKLDFPAYFDPANPNADRESVREMLQALWEHHLGQSAPLPDYILSSSDSADVEVTFATDQGGETHYLFLQGENFYDIWLQEGALSPEAGQAAMDRIMADL